jgi:hypothetical protein
VCVCVGGGGGRLPRHHTAAPMDATLHGMPLPRALDESLAVILRLVHVHVCFPQPARLAEQLGGGSPLDMSSDCRPAPAVITSAFGSKHKPACAHTSTISSLVNV